MQSALVLVSEKAGTDLGTATIGGFYGVPVLLTKKVIDTALLSAFKNHAVL